MASDLIKQDHTLLFSDAFRLLKVLLAVCTLSGLPKAQTTSEAWSELWCCGGLVHQNASNLFKPILCCAHQSLSQQISNTFSKLRNIQTMLVVIFLTWNVGCRFEIFSDHIFGKKIGQYHAVLPYMERNAMWKFCGCHEARFHDAMQWPMHPASSNEQGETASSRL